MPAKTRRVKRAKKAPDSGITGRYVYDPKTDRLVKVSDRIPGIASKSSAPSPCGRGPCGRRSCPR